MECLFIGGPVDGEFLKVDSNAQYIEVPEKPKLELVSFPETLYVPIYNIIIYERQPIVYQELYFWPPKYSFVYVKKGLKFGFG